MLLEEHVRGKMDRRERETETEKREKRSLGKNILNE
jgi:hypothetical protein